MSEVEDFLAHYGVKGMRWGVRKSNAQRKIDRLNTDSAIAGYGYRGHYAQKKAKRYAKKIGKDEFTRKDFAKLSKKDQIKYERSIKRAAYSGIVGRGFVEAALVGGGGTLLVKGLKVNKKDAQILKVGGTYVMGHIAVGRTLQAKAIRDSYRLDRLREELNSKENS